VLNKVFPKRKKTTCGNTKQENFLAARSTAAPKMWLSGRTGKP